jgi:uncharacterized protein with HEPN domain
MIPRRSASLLRDAIRSAAEIEAFTKGQDLGADLESAMLRAAAERHFTILGEALGVPRRSDPATAGRILDLARIVDFRNLLIHDYRGVDSYLVWNIVQTRLAPLAVQIGDLLAQAPPPDAP